MAGNVISGDAGNKKTYLHSGFSSSITNSFASAKNVYGVAWDGTNVFSADAVADKLYKYDGFSSTITDSFSTPSTGAVSCAWDGTNALSSDIGSDKIYQHSGFSATVSDSFSSPSTDPYGVSWGDPNVISADSTSTKVYLHSGFSSTVSDSFSNATGILNSVGWDGTNVLTARNTDKIYQHSGFSSTINDSFSSPSGDPYGVTWESTDATTTTSSSTTTTTTTTTSSSTSSTLSTTSSTSSTLSTTSSTSSTLSTTSSTTTTTTTSSTSSTLSTTSSTSSTLSTTSSTSSTLSTTSSTTSTTVTTSSSTTSSTTSTPPIVPMNLYVYISGTDYSDYVLNYEFKEQQNDIGEFYVDLVAVGNIEKGDIQRGVDVQLRLNDDLIFNGLIEHCEYKTDWNCTIKGYGKVETYLKNAVVKETSSSDGTSSDGRPSYGVGTVSGVATTTIVSEQLSGVATATVDSATNGYLGHTIIRSEFDNVLGFLDSVAENMSGVWWTSYGATPFRTFNYFNIGKARGASSSVMTFDLVGPNQNATASSKEVDEENLWNSVVALGQGDGESQLKSRCYHATDNWTRLSSGCTVDDVIITVESTDGFDSSSVGLFEDWESGEISGAIWTTTAQGGATATVQDVVKKNGTYSLELAASGFDNVNVVASIPYGSEYSCWTYVADMTDGNSTFTLSDINSSSIFTMQLGLNDDQARLIYRYGGSNKSYTFNTPVFSATWYKTVFTHDLGANTLKTELISGTEVIESITKDLDRVIPRYLRLASEDGAPTCYYDDISVTKPGIVVGQEIVTYTSSTSTTFAGCTRAPIDVIVGGQQYYKKYAHSNGVAVYDAKYIEELTDGNSKIDKYGLKQKVLVDKRISDQDTLDLFATNSLLDHYEPIERIILNPSELYDCLNTVVVGDIVNVDDNDSLISGAYVVVGQKVKNDSGLEDLEYEVTTNKSSFTRDLRIAQQTAKNESQFDQGSTPIYNLTGTGSNISPTVPLDFKFYFPKDIKRVTTGRLDLQISDSRTANVSVGILSGSLSTVTSGIVSGTSVDLTDWLVSGIDLSAGNWVIVRTTTNDTASIVDASLYIKCFVEAK